jgi:hypothetical protein
MAELLLNLTIGPTSMKKNVVNIFIIFNLLILFNSKIMGQTRDDFFTNEKVNLFTDRSLYVAGEPIFFTASVIAKENKSKLSKVLYVELITPIGESLSKGKYLIENSVSNGSILIPKETISGIYYLKVYTKLLRSFGPNYYCYNSIKIVNPNSSEVLSASNNAQLKSNSIREDSSIISTISLTTNKERYTRRDTLIIEIRNNNSNLQIENLCLSVIPKASFKDQIINKKTESMQISKLSFYPETQGISLTGKLIDSKNGTSLFNKKINLSIIGLKDHFSINTDVKGRFFFILPNFVGVKDIYINSESIDDIKSAILIDNDFCQERINLPSPAFELADDEKELFYNFATNVQASSYFPAIFGTLPDSTKTYANPFYGQPSEVLIFDKYVKLSSTEEYINELLPTVKIRKQKGNYSFRVIGNQPEMTIYDPLVLIDMVAINDPNRILNILPEKIDRIETISSPYIKGGTTYGGIISIISKNKDYAGIDLPTSGVFLSFNFWSKNCSLVNDQVLLKNQPDLRNTLFWESGISLPVKGEKVLKVKTSDSVGEYLVVFRGLNSKGKTFMQKTSFFVYK